MPTNKISKVQLNDIQYLLKGDADNIREVMASIVSDLYSRIDTGSDNTTIQNIIERLSNVEEGKASQEQIEELWEQINNLSAKIPNSTINYFFAYKKSSEAPNRPVNTEEYPPQGWKSYPESPSSDEVVYMTMARKVNNSWQNWADGYRWTQPIAYSEKSQQTLIIESNIALYRLSSGTLSLSEQERKTPSYPNGWSTTPDFVVQNNQEVYMITAKTINGKYQLINGYYWSSPMRIGGGTTSSTGSDTTVYNYIYFPSNDATAPDAPSFTVRQIEEAHEIYGWYDRPQGISEGQKYEYVSLSVGEGLDRNNWSQPVLWSKWGERGMDGDGVEYIYTRNNHGAIPVINYDISDPAYQEDDYIPTSWTDQPKGVSENLAYEFVAQRKQKDGVWQRFSNPSLWAKYGKNGQQGNQGISGAVVRYIGDWSSVVENATNHEFVFECNTPEGANIRYIDVVTMPSADNRLDYYQCKEAYTTNANSPSPDQDSTHWEPAQHYKFLVTDALIANYIASNTISANDVIIKEGEGQNMSIVAGMTSSNASCSDLGDVRIWAGTEGDQPNIQNAPFIVNNKGDLYAENATIQGNIYATNGEFNGVVNATSGSFQGNVSARSLEVLDNNGNIVMQFKPAPSGIDDIPEGTPMLFVHWNQKVYKVNMTELTGQNIETTYEPETKYIVNSGIELGESLTSTLKRVCHQRNGNLYKQADPNHYDQIAGISTTTNCYLARSTDPTKNGKLYIEVNGQKVEFTGYCLSEKLEEVCVGPSDQNNYTGLMGYIGEYYENGNLIGRGGASNMAYFHRIGTHAMSNGEFSSEFADESQETIMQSAPLYSNSPGIPSYYSLKQLYNVQASISDEPAPNPGQID